jgi:hypothetical protein
VNPLLGTTALEAHCGPVIAEGADEFLALATEFLRRHDA